MKRTDYVGHCLLDHIAPSAIWGGVFHGIDCLQGAQFSFRSWGFYSGGIFAYHALICPMEAIQGKRSAWHNVASGSIFGYIGVSRGVLGVPFVNPYYLYGSRFPPAFVGAAVYGGMGGALAALGGKQF